MTIDANTRMDEMATTHMTYAMNQNGRIHGGRRRCLRYRRAEKKQRVELVNEEKKALAGRGREEYGARTGEEKSEASAKYKIIIVILSLHPVTVICLDTWTPTRWRGGHAVVLPNLIFTPVRTTYARYYFPEPAHGAFLGQNGGLHPDGGSDVFSSP